MFTIRAEEIMTPRHLLRCATTTAVAVRIARENDFDAIPFIGPNGLVKYFWSRESNSSIKIVRQHRIEYDAPVERLLPSLGAHVAQFVYYRSQCVGLVDASDLNKPIARLILHLPMIELERSIVTAIESRYPTDEEQELIVGKSDSRKLWDYQNRDKRPDLRRRLIEYAGFPLLLRVAEETGIASFNEAEKLQLKPLRDFAAHGAQATLIQKRADCNRISAAIEIARRATRDSSRHIKA